MADGDAATDTQPVQGEAHLFADIKHWRGLQAIFAIRAAPMLEVEWGY